MEKQIHVNSYYRKDGTFVDEHYRTIDSDVQEPSSNLDLDPMENPDPYFPDGDYPTKKLPDGETGGDSDGDSGGGGWDIAKNILVFVLQAAQIVAAIINALNNSDSQTVSQLKPQFNNAVGNMKKLQSQSEKLSKDYLNRLASTKDKDEYSNLLKSYKEQSDITRKIKDKITRIEYASENNNYTAVMEDLNSFKTDFDKVMQKTRETRPLNKIENSNHKNILPSYFAQVPSPYINSNLPPSINGNKKTYFISNDNNINKFTIDRGMNLYNWLGKYNNSNEFWKASSHDFRQSKDYINQNGTLVYSVKDLPTEELQNIVSQQLQKQFEKSATLGVIFKPYSQISQLISESSEIKDFFLKNRDKLIKGHVINSSSIFKNNDDLIYAIKKFDILFANINESGDLNLVILDTYDFNKNDSDWRVKIARTVEDAGIIREYYILILIRISIYQLLQWLFDYEFNTI